MTNQQWLEKIQKRAEALVEKEVFVSCSALMRSLDASDEIEFYGDFEELHDDGQIKQYWIVSDFLHEKLYNVGAVVMEYKNLKIWGRTEASKLTLALGHINPSVDENLKKIARQLEHHDESLAWIENRSKKYYASKYGWNK
jgi:hypothetical protein